MRDRQKPGRFLLKKPPNSTSPPFGGFVEISFACRGAGVGGVARLLITPVWRFDHRAERSLWGRDELLAGVQAGDVW